MTVTSGVYAPRLQMLFVMERILYFYYYYLT